jgi:hypothetical protein
MMPKTTLSEEDVKAMDAVLDELQAMGMYKKEISHEERFRIAVKRIAKGDLEDYIMVGIARAAESAAEMVDEDA